MRTNYKGVKRPEKKDLIAWKYWGECVILNLLATIRREGHDISTLEGFKALLNQPGGEGKIEKLRRLQAALADIELRIGEVRRGRPIKPGSRGRGAGLIGQYMKRAPLENGRPKQLPPNFDSSVFLMVSQKMQGMATLRPGEKVTVTSTLKRMMLDKAPEENGSSDEEVLGLFERYRAAYNRGKSQHRKDKKVQASQALTDAMSGE